MSQDDLRTFYRSIDLVIVPSHFETFCNEAAEALLNGCSVLVSKQVGFSEVLQRAGLGRMVVKTFEDPIHAAMTVKKLAKMPLSKKEREAVIRLIDSQSIHERIIDVLEKVLEDNEMRQ